MQLRDWLAAKGLSIVDFAKKIDRTPEAVRRYANGERIPDKTTMPAIAAETAGEVTANDFFGIAQAAIALCTTCDRRADDPQVSACTQADCGLREREAA